MAKEKSDKKIEDGIRARMLEAIDELHYEYDRLSYTQIMTDIGDHQQSRALLISGRRYPTLKNVVLLCSKFGYSETWILFGTGSKRKKGHTDPLTRLAAVEVEVKELKSLLKNMK